VSGLPATVPELRALLRDPDFRIRADRSQWEETGNPVYVWEAVAVCAERKRPFPEWVVDYLGGVAQRMTSADTRAATDVRKVLPKIMGFPAKPGPGRPLDPDGGKPEDALLLAVLFAAELEFDKRLTPSAALRKAAAHADLPVDVASRDDRTLLRWVMQAAGLEHKPRTNADLRAALRSRFGAFATLIEEESARISRDSG
jgi:hypothetical protein